MTIILIGAWYAALYGLIRATNHSPAGIGFSLVGLVAGVVVIMATSPSYAYCNPGETAAWVTVTAGAVAGIAIGSSAVQLMDRLDKAMDPPRRDHLIASRAAPGMAFMLIACSTTYFSALIGYAVVC